MMTDHPVPLSPAERVETTGPWAAHEPKAPMPAPAERPTLSTIFTLQVYAVEVWWRACLALPGVMLDAMRGRD